MIYGKSFNSRWETNVNGKVKGDDLRVQAKHAECYSIFTIVLKIWEIAWRRVSYISAKGQ